MEIKLSAGDKIQVPTGCKATIEDNQIIIEKKQEEEFKDGDILSISLSNNKTMPFINKGVDERGFYKFYVGLNCYGKAFVCPSEDARWGRDTPVRATEEEKRAFFDDLKAKGVRWNGETKELEKIRRRVKEDEAYLYIHCSCEVFETIDARIPFDDTNFKVGNYYPLEERAQAEEDAKAIKAIFEKRLKI